MLVMAMAQHRLFTLGHGAAQQQEFVDRLTTAGIKQLVDVRIAPGSRKHPHFGKDQLQQWLPAADIEYRWEKRLGGFRKLDPDSPDVALRNESFRAYAGYMRSVQFRQALEELLERAQAVPTAIMCSETVWWRCHRRLIADTCVLVEGFDVEHLMPQGRRTAHKSTSGARLLDGKLVYDDRG